MEEQKRLQAIAGPRSNPVITEVELNGVLANETLTPKMARRAARVAFGHSNCVTVWDWEHNVGYRLYKHTARKLHPDE